MNTVPIQLVKESKTPLYLQLVESLKKQIENGDYQPKAPLPSIRKLAQELNVNNSTVIQAYKQLESENLISCKKGSGYYVQTNMLLNYHHASLSQTHQDMTKSSDTFPVKTINFAGANPNSNLFPLQTFQKYMNYVFERDQSLAFSYQELNGYEPLRESFSDYLKRYQNIEIKKDNLTIISGAQQGIDLISKVLLNPNDKVIVEKTTYYGALEVFQSRGSKMIGIKLNEDGLDIAQLEKQLAKHQPKLLYIMTKFQNPTTISYSIPVMKKLIELAEKYQFYIVEEDSISEMIYHQDAHHPPLKYFDNHDRVIYIKSFSKLMMPGLRIGFMVVPQQLQGAIEKAKRYTDISTPGLIQRTVDLFLRTGEFDDYLEQFRHENHKKYQLMLEKLNELKEEGITFSQPDGGLYLWVKFPPTINVQKLYDICQSEHLRFTPGFIFSHFDKEGESFIRFSFADCCEQEINRGFFIFKQCLKKL